MNPDTELALVEGWLANKGVTLWMDWDISQPERRRQAAQWFLKSRDEFDRYVINLTARRVDL